MYGLLEDVPSVYNTLSIQLSGLSIQQSGLAIKCSERRNSFLFNDAINAFLYDSDRERGNLLPPLYGLLSPISSKGFFLHAPSHREDSTHHDLRYTSRGVLPGTRNSSVGSP